MYLTKIISNYLQQRTFRVALGTTLSDVHLLPAGVPQGSLLGPLLYILYTADIPALPCDGKIFLFADDTAIAVKGRSLTEVSRRAQRCLDTYIQYASSWKTRVNVAKSQVMIVPHRRKRSLIPTMHSRVEVNGVMVEWTNKVKYLGLTLDSKMLSHGQVESILRQGQTLLMSLYPLISRRSRLSFVNKLAVFKQIIQPAVLYGCQVWGTCARVHRQKIQVMLNKMLRMIANCDRYTRNSDLYDICEVTPLDSYIQQQTTKLIEKCRDSTHRAVREIASI